MLKITFKKSVLLLGLFLIGFASFANRYTEVSNRLLVSSNNLRTIDLTESKSEKYSLRQVFYRLNSLFLPKRTNTSAFFSNECATATQLTVNEDATCEITTAGNFETATLSTGFTMGCDEWQTPDKDVFYKFTATATQHAISFTADQSEWTVYLQLFNIDACTTAETALYCGQSITANNLVVGNEYLVRVFMTTTWGGPEANFEVCVRTLSAPDNDECEDAIVAPVNSDDQCTETVEGIFQDATVSTGFNFGCGTGGVAQKDVWFEFTATAIAHAISIQNYDGWNLNFEVYHAENGCEVSTPLICSQGLYFPVGGLQIGDLYKIRVFSTSVTDQSTFTLCVSTIVPVANDLCEEAIEIPVNPSEECIDTVDATFENATLSGGFAAGCNDWQTLYKDVWLEFTATSDAHAVSVLNYEGWSLGFQVYHAENGCVLETPLSCVSGNYLVLGNLEIGNLYKVRVFSTNAEDQSTFSLCVTTLDPPINDECDGSIVVPVNSGEECLETLDATFNGSTLSNGFENTCNDGTNASKDVWFKFTATTATHGISFSNYDENFQWNMGVEVFNAGPCDQLGTALSCSTDVSSQVNNLVVGNEYLIRVFSTNMSLNSDFTICINSLSPPIYVSETDYTVEELVKEVLVGNECLISNISWKTGTDYTNNLGVQSDNGIGYFSKNDSSFEFEEGIVLSTGKAELAVGPANGNSSGDSWWLGDADLSAVLAQLGQNGSLMNASVLEFDFTPTVADFKFDFIFASNEYGTYQCNYSDAFAFLLTDLTTNITDNLAVIPGTNIPVSVTTIRDGQYNSSCDSENIEYFDSFYDEFDGLDPMLSPITFFGRTVPLTAQTTVVPGRTYHIKMVIADYGPNGPDTGVDSAVFLLGGSFNIGTVDLGDGLTFENDKALCYGDEYIIETGLGDEFNFKWYRNDVLIPGETDPSLTVTESGTYKIEAAFGDTDCGLEDEITIEFYPDLNTIIEDPEDIIICDDVETIDLTMREQEMIADAEGTYSFEYYLTPENLENGTGAITDPQNYEFNGKVTIFVKVVTPGENSCYASKELLVDVLPVKDPMLINDILICNGYKLPQLPAGQRYFTGSEASGEELQSGQILREGTYNLFVYSNNGKCFEEHEFRVIVENCIIPKGISPNGDGLNDSFDLAKYYPTSVKIYNRYGAMVYEHGAGYTNQWLGQDKGGKILPSGTYFYKFTTETDEYTGYIYIQREVK